MYICKECGEVFSEPSTYEESYPYGESYATQTFGCCPCCGEGNYEEAKRCPECDEWVTEDEAYNGMCDNCKEMYRKDIVNAIANLFTKETLDNLPDDIFDDLWEDLEKVYKEKAGK